MAIKDNIKQIQAHIADCCIQTGRSFDDIRLMAVSKFQPRHSAEEAFLSGLNLFGESRVREASEKFFNFADRQNYELHLIGSLQRNKVKLAVETFDCIESVDRSSLIDELGKATTGLKKTIKLLFELNAGEEQKSGYKTLDEVFYAVEKVLEFPFLKIAGFMTMAPFTDDETIIRAAFKALFNAQQQAQQRFSNCDWATLSMGMSNDYKIAIQEGSTLIRIGTSIFGDRSA
ncbi:MAG: YggS family pyridoxal phosphate-dependent enzyme [Termitinemataceae bacterium]|nr:MAG: YggS family pyridoxal phosphate-dependent enzyme [Termitinemataceae bacterium]